MTRNTGLWIAGGVLGLLALSQMMDTKAKPGSFVFPFNDAAWLSGQKNGGLAFVGDDVDASAAPLLVWLHGNNDGGPLHRGLGSSGFDLRSIVPSSFVVAGPSQNKGASGASLWRGFDLDAFVAEVERATGVTVDRNLVFLAGHSGANCNLAGGTLSPLGSITPAKVIAIDGCLNERYGQAYGALGEKVPVDVYYQRATWPRDYAAFGKAFAGRGLYQEILVPAGGNAHEDIVPIAIQRAIG